MKQNKINIVNSSYIKIETENIDTDQIIPARFLKATSKVGFGDKLFYDWRYDSQNNIIKDSIFNIEKDSNIKILVCGKNFGCGSSREHAAWAIADYGFQIVVSSFFADIFKNNALNNGVLPITISESLLSDIFKEHNSNTKLEINLYEQKITLCNNGKYEFFNISKYKKECLLKGFDDIDYLIDIRNLIEDYEIL